MFPQPKCWPIVLYSVAQLVGILLLVVSSGYISYIQDYFFLSCTPVTKPADFTCILLGVSSKMMDTDLHPLGSDE